MMPRPPSPRAWAQLAGWAVAIVLWIPFLLIYVHPTDLTGDLMIFVGGLVIGYTGGWLGMVVYDHSIKEN
jgi:hypothetical protein